MNNLIIETSNLCKCYGVNMVVSHVNIHVQKGSIYGLLGRNGAGKTSIMKMMLGLTPITDGNITMFGMQFPANKAEILRRVGVMIETPGFYPNLTATENLQISDISHQLKTPLAALNIYNGLLQGETEELPELQEFTTLSEKELDRIETLVQNLLKITKLDAGSIVFEKTSENVADILGEVELHFAYRAKQEQKELVLSGDDHISLFCDHDWMIEAIENIVKNAFDHTEQGKFIRIEWKQSASMVQIIIKDNGNGIHPEDLHHIFKRFYRSRFSKDKQGIGLGLPLAKMIIEAHRGTIEVDSELGIGTTFTLNFLNPTKL